MKQRAVESVCLSVCVILLGLRKPATEFLESKPGFPSGKMKRIHETYFQNFLSESSKL